MLTHLNYFAVLVATLVYFVIGSLWYSLLFGKIWMGLIGATVTEADKKRMPAMFAKTFLLNFVICFAVSCIMHLVRHPTVFIALKISGTVAVGLVAAPIAMGNMYSKRPFKLTVIDSGYHILSILVVSLILSFWR